MPAAVRCKMRVSEVLRRIDPDGATSQEIVKLCAVYGPEGSPNYEWSKYTPTADVTINISNPNAFGKLSQGHEFFVDFTPCGQN